MVLRRIYRVGEITSRIRGLLESDELLADLWIRGELSNFKRHTSGHLYFTLKDSSSCLRCVMFRSRASLLEFQPVSGMNVLARGYISLYERDGTYQLYVEELAPDGVGSLYLAYCMLKERLEKEGLFASERKKPIPFLPRKVGVVTSPSGAAWRDIMTVVRRRFPQMPLVLAPAAVQGEAAPREIRDALAALDRRDDIDVVIVGRGGGSLEELWAFNTEEVARAISQMRLPVVSAVGHERDYTIADLVADLRAPTPSAAAELVVPDRRQLERRLFSLQERLKQAILTQLQEKRGRVKAVAGRTLLRSVQNRLTLGRQQVNLLNLRLLERMRTRAMQTRGRTELLAEKLHALSPLAVLQRGYSFCRDPLSGRIIKRIKEVQNGGKVEVILQDGRIDCQVKGIRKEAPYGGTDL